jgi:hypothetical protein
MTIKNDIKELLKSMGALIGKSVNILTSIVMLVIIACGFYENDPDVMEMASETTTQLVVYGCLKQLSNSVVVVKQDLNKNIRKNKFFIITILRITLMIFIYIISKRQKE